MGELHFATKSVERPEELLWQTTLAHVCLEASVLTELLVGLERWVSNLAPLSIVLFEDEVRLRVELKTEDDYLVLGPGKAGLHYIWDGVAIRGCEVAFVVDQTCVRESASTLRDLLADVH